MPISGGGAYYDKFKKKPAVATQAPSPAAVPQPVYVEPQAPVKDKLMTKSAGSGDRTARPAKKMRSSYGMGAPAEHEPGALDEVVAQILDLAQRVHSVAGQAEAAILRAEAAVMKAEVAVGKAETAAARADSAVSKCEGTISRVESLAFKADASAKRAELSASKAGLAAGKTELAAVGRETVSIFTDANAVSAPSPEPSEEVADGSDGEDNRTKEIESPLGKIAAMSMKLRSGMRQIEETGEPSTERYGYLRAGANINMSLGREDLASGLVSVDNETSLPRVAPFIMDDVSHDITKSEGAGNHGAEQQTQALSGKNGISTAA